jgi:hypothetical protein
MCFSAKNTHAAVPHIDAGKEPSGGSALLRFSGSMFRLSQNE